jgi:PAS domain S-box-containing protein
MTKGPLDDTAKVHRMIGRLLKLPRISIQTVRHLEALKEQLEREIGALTVRGESGIRWPRTEDDGGGAGKRAYESPAVNKYRHLRDLPVHQRAAAEELLRDVNELATILDKDRRWVSVTESFARLLGYRTMDMIGKRIDEFTVEQSIDVEFVFESFARLGEMEGLWMFKHRDGHSVLMRYHARMAAGYSHSELKALLVA